MPAKAKSIRLDRRVDSMFQKTKMCKFFAKGACARGSQCIFAHGHAELAPMPDFACTKICPALMRSGACRDMKCKFAHDYGQLRPRVADRVSDEAPQAELSHAAVHFTRELVLAGAPHFTSVYPEEPVKAAADEGLKPTPTEDRKGCWSRQTTAESASGGQQAPDDDDFSDISDSDSEDVPGELVGLEDVPSDLASNLAEDEVPAGLEEISDVEGDHSVMFQVCVANTFINLVEDAPKIAVRKIVSAPDLCILTAEEEEEEEEVLEEAPALAAAAAAAEPTKKEEGEQLYSSESTVSTVAVVSTSDFSEWCPVRPWADVWVPEAVVKNTFLNFPDTDEIDDVPKVSIRKVASAPGTFTRM